MTIYGSSNVYYSKATFDESLAQHILIVSDSRNP
jgi:hypothetical protein